MSCEIETCAGRRVSLGTPSPLIVSCEIETDVYARELIVSFEPLIVSCEIETETLWGYSARARHL